MALSELALYRYWGRAKKALVLFDGPVIATLLDYFLFGIKIRSANAADIANLGAVSR